MNYIRRLPIILSALVLAAHFFRAQNFIFVLVSLAVLPLVFMDKQWVQRSIRVFLVLGGIEWIRTMLVLVMEREALGMPWLRMSIILGGVALFTIGSSFALRKNSLPEPSQL